MAESSEPGAVPDPRWPLPEEPTKVEPAVATLDLAIQSSVLKLQLYRLVLLASTCVLTLMVIAWGLSQFWTYELAARGQEIEAKRQQTAEAQLAQKGPSDTGKAGSDHVELRPTAGLQALEQLLELNAAPIRTRASDGRAVLDRGWLDKAIGALVSGGAMTAAQASSLKDEIQKNLIAGTKEIAVDTMKQILGRLLSTAKASDGLNDSRFAGVIQVNQYCGAPQVPRPAQPAPSKPLASCGAAAKP